jgi:hypothetical protein
MVCHGGLSGTERALLVRFTVGKTIRIEEVSPSTIIPYPFETDHYIDSPQAVELAWAWMKANGLIHEPTRQDGLALSQVGNDRCGRNQLHDQIGFRNPDLQLCLDPISSEVKVRGYAPDVFTKPSQGQTRAQPAAKCHVPVQCLRGFSRRQPNFVLHGAYE